MEPQYTDLSWQEIHKLACTQLEYNKRISMDGDGNGVAPLIPEGVIDESITDPYDRYVALAVACSSRLAETVELPASNNTIEPVAMEIQDAEVSQSWKLKVMTSMDILLDLRITIKSTEDTEQAKSFTNRWNIDPKGNLYMIKNEIKGDILDSAAVSELVRTQKDIALQIGKSIIPMDIAKSVDAGNRIFSGRSSEPYEELDDDKRVRIVADRFVGQLKAIKSGTFKTSLPRNWNGNPYVGSAAIMLNMALVEHPDWSPVFLNAEQISSLGLNFVNNPKGTRIVNKDSLEMPNMSSVVYNVSETDFATKFPRHDLFSRSFIEENRSEPRDISNILSVNTENRDSFMRYHSGFADIDETQKAVLTKIYETLSEMRIRTVNNEPFTFNGFSEQDYEVLSTIPPDKMILFVNCCGRITESIVNDYRLNVYDRLSMDAINSSINKLIDREEALEQDKPNSPKIK